MNPIAVALVQVIIAVMITAIANRMMSPKGIKAQKLDDFTFPTVSADRAIPVIIGDCLVEGPNVTWFGDFYAHADKEGGSFFAPTTVVGYQYSVGMELVLGWGPLDHLTEIRFDDAIAWEGDLEGATAAVEFQVSAENLFGGNKKGGGVAAKCFWYSGSIGQSANEYMTGQVGAAYAHKGVSKLVWTGRSNNRSGYVGESSVVPPMKFRASHYPNLLGTPYKRVGGTHPSKAGANPVEVVYMLLLGRYIHLDSTDTPVPSIPADMLMTQTFIDAAQTVYNEGMGVSFQWQRDTPVKEIIADILEHINGELCEDSQTGQIRMTLKRNDYDPNDLVVFDETNIKDFTSYVRVNPTAAVNKITGSYTDPEQNFKTIPVFVEDLGNVFEQDMGAPGEIDLHMFHDAEVTIDRMMMHLVQLSEGIISGTFIANRKAAAINVGQPIKVNWTAYGISNLIVRVTMKKVGNLANREIEIGFIQDIYSLGTAVYSPPLPSGWVDILTLPQDIIVYKYFEFPYFMVNRFLTINEKYSLALLTDFPTGDTFSYEPWISINAGRYENGYGSTLGEDDYNTLVFDYDISEGPALDPVGLVVSGQPPKDMLNPTTLTNIQNYFDNWILIDDELMAYESVVANSNGTYSLVNVYRGLLDTSPQTHPSGSKVWFLGPNFKRIPRNFSVAESVNIKTLTSSGKGTLDISAAAAKPWTYLGRYDLAPCPANIKINNVYYPTIVSGPVVITWNRRNKVTSTNLNRWDAADQTPEVGQTVTVRILGQSGQLLRTYSGLTGTSQTYPVEQELIDAGAYQSSLTVEVYSVLAAKNSFDKFIYTFQRVLSQSPINATLPLFTVSSSSSADLSINLDEVL